VNDCCRIILSPALLAGEEEVGSGNSDTEGGGGTVLTPEACRVG
jgi:hypothetical protein